MKVLFLSRRFYPHIGGVEKHVLELGKRLVEKKHSVTVITEAYSDNNQIRSKSAKLAGNIFGIKIYHIPVTSHNFFKKFHIWSWLWQQRNLIQKADVIHCHDVFFWYLPFRFLYPYKKVYTTFHGYEGNSLPTKRAVFMHKLAEKLSFGNICVGAFLTKWYGTKPTFVTYGATFQGHGIAKTQSSKKKNKTYHATFVGRLEEETGFMVYVWALLLLKEKGYHISLTVCGDGSQKALCEDFIKNYNLPVTFVGFVKDVLPYIKQSDFVFVSRYLGILESLSIKKPVFALYNNAIKKDYLYMTPFRDVLIICKNENELIDNFLTHFQDNKQRAAKINQGYIWVKKQTWENLCSRYLALWKS